MKSKLINEIVEIISDDFYEELKRKQPQSKDEAMEMADDWTNKILEDIGCELQDIADDYGKEKGLKWLDE